jgi:hypothetical protein
MTFVEKLEQVMKDGDDDGLEDLDERVRLFVAQSVVNPARAKTVQARDLLIQLNQAAGDVHDSGGTFGFQSQATGILVKWMCLQEFLDLIIQEEY